MLAQFCARFTCLEPPRESVKLGIGLYRHQLDDEHFAFARQAGCTHLVVHLVDYFRESRENRPGDQPTGDLRGWGRAGDAKRLWNVDELKALVAKAHNHGLAIAAIENLDPAHWHDVLLDGPRKAEQLANIARMIEAMGEAAIPCLGYNFSLAGVAGRVRGAFARGGAMAVGMDGPVDDPVPNGMVWNMVYDESPPVGHQPAISHEELWRRLDDFLSACLPVAERVGVVLAAHPDDPPLPFVRSTPRLVYQPALYQKLIDLHASPSNQLEFCIGSIAEMSEGDVYSAIDAYSRQGRIAYVHFRNVAGKVPHYRETFIDDGDIDMARVVGILKRNGFDGVLIPDHAPQMSCPAPWHAGMAHALGYMQALLKTVSPAPPATPSTQASEPQLDSPPH